MPFFLLAIVALFGYDASSMTEKVLGLTSPVSLAIYLAILLGSLVNIPVYDFKSSSDTEPKFVSYMGMRYPLPVWHGHKTVIAINLGGCIISGALGIYLAWTMPLLPLLLTVIIVALAVYATAQPVRSVGVIVPVWIPPVVSIITSFIAIYLYADGNNFFDLARMAFPAGVFGTIAGANVLHAKSIRRLGASVVSAGGVGTFESILITGMISTIIAALLGGAA
ncbi:DUF1614 domain-containing protein [Methanooceanicella nereidis]|uniref:DUF1614 domain-containing protein n=1 Tax=Methanooceanicella nereidis TaxID=2052831 RepID=UPI001E5DB752